MGWFGGGGRKRNYPQRESNPIHNGWRSKPLSYRGDYRDRGRTVEGGGRWGGGGEKKPRTTPSENRTHYTVAGALTQ